MGSPGVVVGDEPVDYNLMENNTFAAFGDLDASPTKAWIIEHRNEPENRIYYDFAFDKRPYEELYDLRNDPDYMTNVAEHPDYQEVKEKLSKELMDTLVKEKDPRVVEDPVRFEHPPYTNTHVWQND